MLVNILIVFCVLIVLWKLMTKKTDDFVVSNITHIAESLAEEKYAEYFPDSDRRYFAVSIIDAMDYLVKKDISINDLLVALATVNKSACGLGCFREEIDVTSFGFDKHDKLFVLVLQLKLMFDLVDAGNGAKDTFENVMKKKVQIANQIKHSREDYHNGRTPALIRNGVIGFFKSDKLKEYRDLALNYDLARSKFSVVEASLSRFFK